MAQFENSNGKGKSESGKVPKAPLLEITEPRCHVCKSKYRHQMEDMLVANLSFSSVAKFFNDMGEEVNRKNLATHQKNHMNLHKAALVNVMEKRARQALIDVDNIEGFITTRQGALEMMLHQMVSKFSKGDIDAKPADVIQVLQYMERLESQQRDVALDEIMQEARAFSAAVKSVVPPSQWEMIVERFDLELQRAKNPLTGIDMESLGEIGQ